MSTVSLREIAIDGRPASVHVGGQGEPLLLVHGGWGGASMHWAPVWDQLAERPDAAAGRARRSGLCCRPPPPGGRMSGAMEPHRRAA